MKKYFFTMMTTAMLFASCSSDDTVVPNNGTENQEDLVEIKLGAGSRIGTSVAESRAAVDNWDNTPIGVYALNQEKSWATDANSTHIPFISTVENAQGLVQQDADNEKNAVDWEDGETRYYPRSGDDKFVFYGYHPYSSTTVPAFNQEGTQLILTGATFDGVTDIMRGNSGATGYNAKYFRETTPTPENPDITFNHLTTRFNIYIQAGENYETEIDKCGITSLTIEVPTTYDLIIAGKDANEDEITDANAISWGSVFEPKEMHWTVDMPQSGGYVLDDKTEGSSSATHIAEAMVQPGLGNRLEADGELAADPYILKVTFSNGDDCTVNIVKGTSLANGFEMGKAYNITLTVHGPQEIAVTATLTAWDTVNGPSFDI